MATITVDTTIPLEGGYDLVKGTFALDASYAGSAGETLDPSNIARVEMMTIQPGGSAASGLGRRFEWDSANQVIHVYRNNLSGAVTVNPGNHTAVTSVNTDVTVTGLATSDNVIVIPPVTLEAGIAVQGAYATATDTLRIRTTNASAGAIDPASASWTWVIMGYREEFAATDLSAVTAVPFQALVAY